MFAAHQRLDNLCVIVDNNGLQIDGRVSEVAGAEPFDEKFASFGFEVIKADGHCFDDLENAFGLAGKIKGKPAAIIAKTIKGKGVSFMEDRVAWHGSAPNAEQYAQAMQELNTVLAGLEG